MVLFLKWGDVDAIEQLVNLIGRREGIGDLLSQGSRRFGAHFGAEEEAVQVNGLETGLPRSARRFGDGAVVCHQSARRLP